MNDYDLESLLRGIKPAAPSGKLFQGIDEELSLDMSWLGRSPLVRRTTRWFTPATFTALGAAAAIAIMSWFTLSTPEVPSLTQGAAVPVSTISEWQDFQNEGIQYTQNQTPQRRIRLIGTERRMYIDPNDGAQIIVETPQEQSFVLPVKFQ